jgi:ectoine hydroxylase-related dioxygenase (phytanoyl-CoA dioxygenase family)
MIDAETREIYERDGVVCLRKAFSIDWLVLAAQAITRSRSKPGPMFIDYSKDTKANSYFGDFWVWPNVPEMRDFIFHSPAAQLAGEVLGVTSTMLVTDNWLVREAGTTNRAPWHHDGPYFDLDGRWCVLWMGLEPIEYGEGIVFLKGSHKWKRHFMPESFAGTGPKDAPVKPYELIPNFTQELHQHDVLEYLLAPGDCLVFDSLTVHGAPNPLPAQTTTRRLTMRFADGEATYRRRGPWTNDMTDYLEENYGLFEGGPYTCELLPILWSSSQTENA